jgi:catechol 2,3-dioxygenase-like lactoylglutathione lyase family enzyme
MHRPPATLGLRHLALWVQQFEACEHFYADLLGMQIEWRPDPDNVYLTSGHDNLALHRAPADFNPSGSQRLDHLGFIIGSPADLQQWYDFLKTHNVKFHSALKQHRDGAHSFYCADPDGNVVQLIYHPPLVSTF